MTGEWIEEWPGNFTDLEDFEDYMETHIPVRENPFEPEKRENRNTASHESRKYGEKFEELLEEKWNDEIEFVRPENGRDRGYDAIIPVETDDGLRMVWDQIKGCFHSKKSNARLNPRISVPYETHNRNGEDYVYDIGVYTFVEDIDNMDILGETVLGWNEMDVLMEYAREEDPVGTNIQDKNDRKNHALFEWDFVFRYAEQVHDLHEEHGFNVPRNELEYLADRTAEEYEETDERQISAKRSSYSGNFPRKVA